MVDGKLHYVTCRATFKDHPDLIHKVHKMNSKLLLGCLIKISFVNFCKVENSDAKFLFLASEDDLSTPAIYSANILAQRLIDNGKASNCEIMVCPKTGHLLEPPYIPFCDYSYHKVVGKLNVLYFEF